MVDIPPKQCFCGRSQTYPYCDGTHKKPKESINSKDFDKEFDIESSIKLIKRDDKDLLDKLGSDYDENGIPYWEKRNEND